MGLNKRHYVHTSRSFTLPPAACWGDRHIILESEALHTVLSRWAEAALSREFNSLFISLPASVRTTQTVPCKILDCCPN